MLIGGFLMSNILKKIFSLPLYYILSYLMMIAGANIGVLVYVVDAIWPSLINNDAWITGEVYLYFWGIWLVFFLCLLIKINKPLINAVSKKAKGNTIKFFIIGVLIGFGLNGICALTALLNKDIHLYFNTFNPITFILLFIVVFIQSSAEELVTRCFLYQHLRRLYKSPLVGIIGNILLFALLHLWNTGISLVSFVNLLISGLLYTLPVYYFDSLWCAFGIHTAWNFTQNILLGLPNSGIVTPYSIFKLDAANAKSSFFYDVSFGIEGSCMSCIVLIIACIVVILIGKKKSWNQDI